MTLPSYYLYIIFSKEKRENRKEKRKKYIKKEKRKEKREKRKVFIAQEFSVWGRALKR